MSYRSIASLWSVLLLSSLVSVFPIGISGQDPEPEPLNVTVCGNRTDSFSICWDPSSDFSISGYCSYLMNSFGGISELTYYRQPPNTPSDLRLRHDFQRLHLTSTYKGCVVVVYEAEGTSNDENCGLEFVASQNASCDSHRLDSLILNLQNGLMIASAAFLLFMYVLIRLADLLCPYSPRKNITYEDYFLHGTEENPSSSDRRSRDSKVKHTHSVKERARKRSDAISEGMATLPPRSPRSPSSLSEISEVSPDKEQRRNGRKKPAKNRRK